MIRRSLWAAVLLVVALPGLLAAQTGTVMPEPKIQFFDNNGDPLGGGKLYSYAAGTTTPQDTYTTNTLGVANANPVILDSAGRATVFLNQSLSYKFELRTSAEVVIWTQDGITGQFSGVITVNVANTRGIQIVRSGADAGMSIESSGGSGKVYGIVSTTTGALQIRDDTDGFPRLEFLGDNVTLALSGTFTVSGLTSFSAFGAHTFSSAGTGSNSVGIRNTTSGTTMAGELQLGNNSTASLGRFRAMSSAFTTAGANIASGITIDGTGVGGVNIIASDASGDVRLFAGGSASAGIALGDTGIANIATLQPGTTLSGTTQPGFFAYNSADDSLADGATLDFDTEQYDTSAAFSGDTFTAPTTGIYQLCAAAMYSANGANMFQLWFLINAVSYQLYHAQSQAEGFANGCVAVSMTAAQTATVFLTTTDAAVTIHGDGTLRESYFWARLLP